MGGLISWLEDRKVRVAFKSGGSIYTRTMTTRASNLEELLLETIQKELTSDIGNKHKRQVLDRYEFYYLSRSQQFPLDGPYAQHDLKLVEQDRLKAIDDIWKFGGIPQIVFVSDKCTVYPQTARDIEEMLED